ncbi:RHS repeat domain-containing protein [Janthinobacterium sp. DSP2-3-3]|uniref:RHS repeat domain-containing protein n=1 Tax=Janthinobacterium sp. DSP2-3-3 TaxID=2804596 RepID=UPI003CF71F59
MDQTSQYLRYTRYYDVYSLTEKVIAGPAVSTQSWKYFYGQPNASWDDAGNVADSKIVNVKGPDNDVTRYTFGNRFQRNEGQLLKTEFGLVDLQAESGGTPLRSVETRYRQPDSANPYPEYAGISDQWRGDGLMSSRFLPVDQRITEQQGVSFVWEVANGASGYDHFARPLSVVRSSGLGYSRGETTTYYDNFSLWVLGQVATVTDDATGKVMISNTYNTHASLETRSSFGKLDTSLTYYDADGTLATRSDGKGQTITYLNYKRGVAQTAIYPDGNAETAVVSDIGLITSTTNAAGFTTRYGYDATGRLNLITQPEGDSVGWYPTTLTFEQVWTAEYGIAAGHWRQTVITGNARTVNYYDAIWRPVMTRIYDSAQELATRKVVARSFNANGQVTFESYPQRDIDDIGTAVTGVSTTYDALGRVAESAASSELGQLNTRNEYVDGFRRVSFDASGNATVFLFHALDQPSEAAAYQIWPSDHLVIEIQRDGYGKPVSVARGGDGLYNIRRYVYDEHERLCKTIEPEAGATVQDYDGANNLTWRASGLALPDTASCDTQSVPVNKKISYQYDNLNQLTRTDHGDGSPVIVRTYTVDGLPLTVDSSGAKWTSDYNKRRLLESETLTYNGASYKLGRSYDGHGAVSSLTYPGDGSIVAYAPNALGEASQVGAYAKNITYHPNGAIAGFTYGNGVVHRLIQNARGKPWHSADTGVIWDVYDYDANGNPTSIADYQEGRDTRVMEYDVHDRLTTVTAPGLWGRAAYSYDALDNLTGSSIAGQNMRTLTHHIDVNTNRLTNLIGPGGYSYSYGYDSQGNITQRGGQNFVFDIGNRLRVAVGKANYQYDGLGHRIRIDGMDGSQRMQVYSPAGQLWYAAQSGGPQAALRTKYIYLNNGLLAEVTNGVVQYNHTDGLGSPVAISNAAGAIVSRSKYEPYGLLVAGTTPRMGFTGHVHDNETGLVYMQQRYYDSVAGRFLSVDPVTTDANTGGSFNRYAYANNSPYKYVDPDGRQSLSGNMPSYLPMVQLEMGVRAWYGQLMEKTTGVLTVASMAVGAPGPAVAKEAIVVTKASIQAALKGAPMTTAQSAVSLPVIANYVQKIEAGMVAPAIKVDGKIIVEGNHRYVAGRVAGKEPAQTAGTASPSQVSQAKPVENIKVDPTDWGNR